MKRVVIIFCLLFFEAQARADLFGGDVAVLTQILVNNIQQLAQLMEILKAGEKQVELMEDLRAEIVETLRMLKTVSPSWDAGIYKEWRTVNEALRKIHDIYGIAVPSPNYQIQQDMDQSIAEAITLNNSLYQYTKEIDDVGEEIKKMSRSVSPGGAQKISAHTQGILLHVLNQSLRAQGTALKLQAQNMAVQNRNEKLLSTHLVATSDEIERELRKKKEVFKLPKFRD